MQPLPNTFRTLVPFIFFLCPYSVSFTHVVTVVISPPSPRIEAVFQAESVSKVTLKHTFQLSLTSLKKIFQNPTQQVLLVSLWGTLCHLIARTTRRAKKCSLL